MLRGSVLTVFLVLGTIWPITSVMAQVDCSQLDPRASVSKEMEAKVKASVDTLYKIAKAGGSMEGKVKSEINNLQKDVPLTEQGLIKLRTLYLFCGMVANAKDISTERKVELFRVMMEVKTSDEQKPKPPTQKKEKTSALSKPVPPPQDEKRAATTQSTTGNQSPAVIASGNVSIIYNNPPQNSKPDLSLGVALYAYEKAFVLQEQTKTYYTEMRNLVSNCSIFRQEVKNLPRGRSVIPEPSAWILIKLRVENTSPVPLTNLRLGFRGPSLPFDKIGCTPNTRASMSHELTMNEGLGTDVVIIESLAPGDTAIVTLQAMIDRKRYVEFTQASRHTIAFPFVVSNQFRASGLKVVKLDASELLKEEAYLFSGERTFVNEKIEFRLLCPDEPGIVEELIKYESLPPALKCATGTAGHW